MPIAKVHFDRYVLSTLRKNNAILTKFRTLGAWVPSPTHYVADQVVWHAAVDTRPTLPWQISSGSVYCFALGEQKTLNLIFCFNIMMTPPRYAENLVVFTDKCMTGYFRNLIFHR